MDANKYTAQQIAKAVSHRFHGGKVEAITDRGVIVKIGNTFTRLPMNELRVAVKQSERPLREDLHQLAKELNNKEDGITTGSLPSSQVSEEVQKSATQTHREMVAAKYGI